MYNNYSAEENPEIITYMSYDEWENIKDNMNNRRKSRIAKERRKKIVYYRRQRMVGALIMLIGIICLCVGSGITASVLQYFGAIVGIIGLYIVITHKMVLVDNYSLEYQDKINEF